MGTPRVFRCNLQVYITFPLQTLIVLYKATLTAGLCVTRIWHSQILNSPVSIGAVMMIFIVGAVFRQLHGWKGDSLDPIGDRVACGLFALPLIALFCP